MLLRHVVPYDCASFAFHTITYASETLNRFLAGVKGRCRRCHDSAAIMDAGLFPRREGSCRQNLIADTCNNRSIAFALVTYLVPGQVVQERRPPRLEIGQRLPLQDVGQLVAGFSDKGRPKSDRTNPVLFPDGRKLVPKASLQLCHLAGNSLIYSQLMNHCGNPLERRGY